MNPAQLTNLIRDIRLKSDSGLSYFTLDKILDIYKTGHISADLVSECAGGMSVRVFAESSSINENKQAVKLMSMLIGIGALHKEAGGSCECGKHCAERKNWGFLTPTPKFMRYFRKAIASTQVEHALWYLRKLPQSTINEYFTSNTLTEYRSKGGGTWYASDFIRPFLALCAEGDD